MKTAIVIPARFSSTRLPGKPLADLCGRPLIWHTVARAVETGLGPVIVATDDLRIRDAVAAFGGQVVMTSPDCRTGTERMAEVARARDEDVFLNLQGDEPLVDPAVPRAVVVALAADPAAGCATAACAVMDEAEYLDPNAVKVVLGSGGQALYFSRRPIPWTRAGGVPAGALRHLGLYAFRRERLLEVAGWPLGALEQHERLEQLRWIERGMQIRVVVVPRQPPGVDTPEDLQVVRRMLADRGSSGVER